MLAPLLKPRDSVYNTRKSQADGVLLEVPHFATSVYKSTKHISLSFAYDAPKIWNDLLAMMMYVWPLLSIHSGRSSKPISLQKHIHPNFCLFQVSHRGADPCIFPVDDYGFLFFFSVMWPESVFRRLCAIKYYYDFHTSFTVSHISPNVISPPPTPPKK